MNVKHGNIEPSLDPVHLFEGQVCEQKAAKEEEAINTDVTVQDGAEEEALVELEQIQV